MSIGIKSWSDDFKKMLEEVDYLKVPDDESTLESSAPLQVCVYMFVCRFNLILNSFM